MLSDLLIAIEFVLITTGEMLPLLVSVAAERCIDFICCTASSRSLVSSADFWDVSLGGLGRLTKGGEDEPFIFIGSVGEEEAELDETDKGGKFKSNRGEESSVVGSGFAVSGGRITLLGGGVGLPASLVVWGT